MKKQILASALLLTNPLTLLNQDILNSARAEVRSHANYGEELYLLSTKDVSFKGVAYTLKGNLTKGKFTDNSNNQLIFEIQGHLYLENIQKERINLGSQDDGEMMFEMVHNDQYSTKYAGFSCSSTFTHCEATNLVNLVFNKQEKTWEASFSIEEQGEKIEAYYLPLKKMSRTF